MSLRYEIAVVGAGVGGLAVAALLRSLGHWVTVYDQAPAPVLDGPGVVLPPAAFGVLERLGIDGAARTLGVRIDGITGHDGGSGDTVLDLSYGSGGALALQRSALVQLLYAEAEARGVDFHFGKRILSAATTGHPYLRIEGGTQAGPFDYLIDAGGAHSPLSPLVARERRFGTVWATVPLPEGESDLGGLIRQRYEGAAQMAAVVPLGTAPGDSVPQAAVYWSLRGARVRNWAAAGIEAFKADVSAFWPDLGDLIGPATEEDFFFAPVKQGGLTRPARRRTARIGEAAHQGNPMFAPGGSLALMDAMVLADCMGEYELEGVSTRYALRRWLHLRAYQGLSLALTPMFQSRFGWQATLRNRVLSPATRVFSGTATRVLDGEVLPMGLWGKRKQTSVRPVGRRTIGEPGE